MSMNFFDRNDNPLVCDESSYQEEITNGSKKHKKVLFQKDSPMKRLIIGFKDLTNHSTYQIYTYLIKHMQKQKHLGLSKSSME